MWTEGVIGIPKDVVEEPTFVHYWVKHYKEPSKYGINNGRISKVMLKIKDEIVCNYDRGWDVRPTNRAAEIALKILLHEIDGRDKE